MLNKKSPGFHRGFTLLLHFVLCYGIIKVSLIETIEDLISGQVYYVILTAYDDEGNETAYADEENIFTTSLSKPAISSITDTVNTVTISWGTVSGATGYKIFYNTDSGESYANEINVGNILTYTIT